MHNYKVVHMRYKSFSDHKLSSYGEQLRSMNSDTFTFMYGNDDSAGFMEEFVALRQALQSKDKNEKYFDREVYSYSSDSYGPRSFLTDEVLSNSRLQTLANAVAEGKEMWLKAEHNGDTYILEHLSVLGINELFEEADNSKVFEYLLSIAETPGQTSVNKTEQTKQQLVSGAIDAVYSKAKNRIDNISNAVPDVALQDKVLFYNSVLSAIEEYCKLK